MLSYYNEDPYHPGCYDCEEKEKQLYRAKDWLESIVEQLYSKEELDLKRFEDHLDELCHQLDIKLENRLIMIQRANK